MPRSCRFVIGLLPAGGRGDRCAAAGRRPRGRPRREADQDRRRPPRPRRRRARSAPRRSPTGRRTAAAPAAPPRSRRGRPPRRTRARRATVPTFSRSSIARTVRRRMPDDAQRRDLVGALPAADVRRHEQRPDGHDDRRRAADEQQPQRQHGTVTGVHARQPAAGLAREDVDVRLGQPGSQRLLVARVVPRQPDLAVAEGRLVGQPQRQPEVDQDGVLPEPGEVGLLARRPGTAAVCRPGRWSRRAARRPRWPPGRQRPLPRSPAAAPASRRARSRRTVRRVPAARPAATARGAAGSPGRRRWARPAASASGVRNDRTSGSAAARSLRRQADGLEQEGARSRCRSRHWGGRRPRRPAGRTLLRTRAAADRRTCAGRAVARRGRPAPSARPGRAGR